jgi:hypothetical protein
MGPAIVGNASVQVNEVRQDPTSYVGLTRIINGRAHGNFTYAEYSYFRDHATTLRAVAAESGREPFLMGPISGGEAEEVQGRFETGNFLASAGLHPAVGRSFSAAEELEGGPPVALLNFRFWKGRYGSDPPCWVSRDAERAPSDRRRGDPRGRRPVISICPGSATAVLGGETAARFGEHWLMLDADAAGTSVQRAQAEVDVLATPWAECTAKLWRRRCN